MIAAEEFPFHHAANFSQVDIMQSLLNQGTHVDSRNDRQETPLHCARTKKAAEFLIKNYADMEARDHRGRTPLMSAFFRKLQDVAIFLIESGADVNYVEPSSWGRNALHYACAQGRYDLDVIRLLVSKVSNINAVVMISGDTALSLAAKCRRRYVVHFLIQSGADVKIGFSSSNTLLHKAAYEGWTHIVEAIVGEFDVNATIDQARTALMLAAARKHHGVVELLLKCGADIYLKDYWDRTALTEAIPDIELITLLIKNGAYLEPFGYTKIYESISCREGILQNEELCTQILINKYNNLCLPIVHQMYSPVFITGLYIW